MDRQIDHPPIEARAEHQHKEEKYYEYRDKQGTVIFAKVEFEQCGKYRRLIGFELKNQNNEILDLFDFLQIGGETFISVGTENAKARAVPRADISSDEIPADVSNLVFVAEPNDPAQFAVFLHEIGHTKQSVDLELSDLWSRRFASVWGWNPERGYPGDLRHGLLFILDEIDAGRIKTLDHSFIESLLTKSEDFHKISLQINERMVSAGTMNKDARDLSEKSKMLAGSDRDECLEQVERLRDESKRLEIEIDELYRKLDKITETFNHEIESSYQEIVDYANQPERWLERDANVRALSWLRKLKKEGFNLLGDVEITEDTERTIQVLQDELGKEGIQQHCLGKPDTATGFLRHALATYGATSHQIKKGKRPVKRMKA